MLSGHCIGRQKKKRLQKIERGGGGRCICSSYASTCSSYVSACRRCGRRAWRRTLDQSSEHEPHHIQEYGVWAYNTGIKHSVSPKKKGEKTGKKGNKPGKKYGKKQKSYPYGMGIKQRSMLIFAASFLHHARKASDTSS